jgi:hypothetical protein
VGYNTDELEINSSQIYQHDMFQDQYFQSVNALTASSPVTDMSVLLNIGRCTSRVTTYGDPQWHAILTNFPKYPINIVNIADINI